MKGADWNVSFETFEDVILTRDVTEHGLRVGDVGTVVERHVGKMLGLPYAPIESPLQRWFNAVITSP